jgi:dipeptidyl aminopeptidase/acylaminoacyl peptidase
VVTRRLAFVGVGLALGLVTPALGRMRDPAPDTEADWAGEAFSAETGGARSPASARISLDDLLELRDIGGLSLSPDGRWLVFAVHQAMPQANRYVLRWFVAPSSGRSPPRALAGPAGEPLLSHVFGLPRGDVLAAPAKWSLDSSRVAFRTRIGARIELWVADPRSGAAHRVADGRSQVGDFAWTPGGRLVFRTGFNAERFDRAVEQEARRGWLLDSRMPLFAARTPSPTEPDCQARPSDPACDVRTWSVARDRLETPAPVEADPGLLDEVNRARQPLPAKVFAASEPWADGARAWGQNADPKLYAGYAPVLRIASNVPGAPDCTAPGCRGIIRETGFARGGRSIWFLSQDGDLGRPDGAPRDHVVLSEWPLDGTAAHRVLRTEDLIEDCHAYGSVAYCERETATRPRHIVAIDLDTGQLTPLFDPNPGFVAKLYPRVRKLALSDRDGNPAFAHLVYPYGYEAGRTYPLVIVQYTSKGFLRGGTGSEYPIYPLAAAGFLVLSLDRPEPWQARLDKDLPTVERWRYEGDLRDRRSVLSTIDQALDQLVAEQLVDPRRVAITGLSSGAEIVHYALQHSRRFAVGIASSGAHDAAFLALAPAGFDRARLKAAFRTSGVVPAEGSPLLELAWSRRPEALASPLLINAGQQEAMMGFEGIQALQDAGRPIEVRVFPDEMHIKYHPQSLAGVYANNLDWLKFWLQGYEDPDPALRDQYQRWRAMRGRLSPASSSGG